MKKNTKFSTSEDGIYSYWLETAPESNIDIIYNINSGLRSLNKNLVYPSYFAGTRPVIEVSKTDIDY